MDIIEALEVVECLAQQNVVDEIDMPDECARQEEALEVFGHLLHAARLVYSSFARVGPVRG